MIPPAMLAAILCVCIRRNFFKRKNLIPQWPRELTMALFTCYLTGLFLLVLVPNHLIGNIWYWIFYHSPSGAHLRLPLWDVSQWAYSFHLGALFPLRLEALGNILLFLPFGCFLPLLWPRQTWKTILYGCFLSFGIELLQMPLGRSFDVRDLVMNTIGTAVGLLLFFLFCLLIPGAVRAISGKRHPNL